MQKNPKRLIVLVTIPIAIGLSACGAASSTSDPTPGTASGVGSTSPGSDPTQFISDLGDVSGDLISVGTDATAGNSSALLTDCQNLKQHTDALIADGVPSMISNQASNVGQMEAYFTTASTDCINGVNNTDATSISAATTAIENAAVIIRQITTSLG